MARLLGEIKVWREVPNDPDQAELEIKYIKPGEKKDIEDQVELYQTMLKPDAAGKLHGEVKINPAKGDARYAYICAAVTNWKNYFDVDGSPMACTDENKIRVARDDEEFGRIVGKFRAELDEQVKKEREAAGKNSKS